MYPPPTHPPVSKVVGSQIPGAVSFQGIEPCCPGKVHSLPALNRYHRTTGTLYQNPLIHTPHGTCGRAKLQPFLGRGSKLTVTQRETFSWPRSAGQQAVSEHDSVDICIQERGQLETKPAYL